jgi:biotin carboxyl carrier protein
MPLWRTLGKATRLFRGRALPKTLAITTALVGLVFFLCYYPWDFKLEGSGKLKPSLRQPVWAEVDGKVDKLLVEHDDQVTKGQLLLVQRSVDLEKEIVSVRGELARDTEKIRSTRKELFGDEELTDVERSQKQSDITQLTRGVESLQKQLDLLLQKQEDLQVRSPLDGRIVTWNVEDRLLGRLVNRGEELLEVADPTSPWELEVTMPESRMGHIAKAWAESNGNLKVTFFLALNPGEKLEGKVEEVHRSAEVRGDEGNTVLLRCSFDQDRLREVIGDPKIDAGATAKVHCGKRPIGYVYLHDLVDFVRAKILFRLF